MRISHIVVGMSLLGFCLTGPLFAQTPDSLAVVAYDEAADYEIGGITVSGSDYSDDHALISLCGLSVGQTLRIPGQETAQAIKALWKLQLFSDVQILINRTVGDLVFLEIKVVETPRYYQHAFRGVKKTYHDNLNKLVQQYLRKGTILTENNKNQALEVVKAFFVEKGYMDAAVTLRTDLDPDRRNAVRLYFIIRQGDRVKLKDIQFTGNAMVTDGKLRRLISTKRKAHLLNGSKYIPEDWKMDKETILYLYQSLGYLDAAIVQDSIWRVADGEAMLRVNIHEGRRYFFGDIAFKGNTIYTNADLQKVLGIKKGEVFDRELLETRLRFSQDGRDVSSLYLDNGYLFFNVDPGEMAVNRDTIDLEIRIYEGPQATIDKVVINGNHRTNEEVIRREIRTEPGKQFSRSDIIRSQREIMNLGYFNPESLDIQTPVDPQRGTVDVIYNLEETNSDQIELSAGWGGAGIGVTGTLGLTLNNFSLRNIFDPSSWSPYPAGDGQRLSLRAQTSGSAYQSYNFSFTEPWLGKKKPNSLTVAGFLNRYTNGVSEGVVTFEEFRLYGATASLGKRLTFPDDNFISTTSLNFQQYRLDNWDSGLFSTDDGQLVTDGIFNNFSITQTIARNTINNPIFPTQGSLLSLSMQFTPPYSLFTNESNNEVESIQEEYRWLEYHKWRFDATWYTTLVGKLVLKASAKIGVLGRYNQSQGISPFERFQLGGDGISNNAGNFTGTDIISLRGYDITDLENNYLNGEVVATPLYDKFTLELRYPLSLNPNATIYALGFFEGGNAFQNVRDFNPFDLKRSVGAGLRVFLPMFGTLGFDYGIGLDHTNANSIGERARFNIILGFEPE